MELNLLLPLVEKIRGCTFASLDALCEPAKGIMQEIKNEPVIIFRTNGKSGYEGMVRRKLQEAGKDPDSFKVGELPWGERMGNLPLLTHNGQHYLQTIRLSEGKTRYYLAGTDIDINPKDFGIKPSRGYQGLPPDETVIMHTYNIKNIERISLFGETVTDRVVADKRSILTIKG